MENDNNSEVTISRDMLLGYAVAMQNVVKKMNLISEELKDKNLELSIGYSVILSFVKNSYQNALDKLKQIDSDYINNESSDYT